MDQVCKLYFTITNKLLLLICLFPLLPLFPRKWISEVFVGVLSGDALLYVWDVIFMHNWSKVATSRRMQLRTLALTVIAAHVKYISPPLLQGIFVRLCLALLGLLRPWLLQATSHAQVVAVLLEEPANLYIQDIRKALQVGRCRCRCRKICIAGWWGVDN